MIHLDFETEAIEDWRPPRPCGLAVTYENGSSEYLTNWAKMRKLVGSVVMKAGKDPQDYCWHNAKYDMAVACKWFNIGLREVDWLRCHDTMAMAFLDNPYSRSVALKFLSVAILGRQPVEQADLREWILSHVDGATNKNWGAYISKAPIELVAPYAMADTEITRELAIHYIEKNKVIHTKAYRRYQRLLPVVIDMEQRGVPVHKEGLEVLHCRLEDEMQTYDKYIYKILGTDSLNLNSQPELYDALMAKNLLDVDRMMKTATGRTSLKEESLVLGITHSGLLDYLKKRIHNNKLISGFTIPWLRFIEGDGRLHSQFSYLRATRTGRFSCSKPNGQQAPPIMRGLVLPDKGHKWVKLDYSQQELRLLAHFCGGNFKQSYVDNPRSDVHQWVADLLGIQRRDAKAINFGTIYGMGKPALSATLGCTELEAGQFFKTYYGKLPEVKSYIEELKARGRMGEEVLTAGGRKYKAEFEEIAPPPTSGGATFGAALGGFNRCLDYKLVNYIMQGSGVDMTMEAMCLFWERNVPDARITIPVHDDISLSSPHAKFDLKTLKECMLEAAEMMMPEVPMVVDGGIGETWGTIL